MRNIYTVFIDDFGELNIEGRGAIANLEDLNFDLCCGNKEILGILKLSDGYYNFFNNMNDEEFIENEVCEYLKIPDEIFAEVKETKTTENIIDITERNEKDNKLMIACEITGILITHVFTQILDSNIIG